MLGGPLKKSKEFPSCRTPKILGKEIPHFATYRAIIVRYPEKQAGKLFAVLSLQVSCDMKSIAAGPLRLRVLVLSCPQLPTHVILLQRESFLQKGPKGHKCAQLQRIAHELQLSPHLRAPIWTLCTGSVQTTRNYHWGQNYYILFLVRGIIFGGSYRKLYSNIFLEDLIIAM